MVAYGAHRCRPWAGRRRCSGSWCGVAAPATASWRSVAVGAAVLLPAFAVARYHVAQRLSSRGACRSPPAQGIVAHALLAARRGRRGGAGDRRGARRAIALAGGAGDGRRAGRASSLGGAGIGVADRSTRATPVAGAPGAARGGGQAERHPDRRRHAARRRGRVDAARRARPSGFARSPRTAWSSSAPTRRRRGRGRRSRRILTAQYPSLHGAVHKMDILPDRVDHAGRGAAGAGLLDGGVHHQHQRRAGLQLPAGLRRVPLPRAELLLRRHRLGDEAGRSTRGCARCARRSSRAAMWVQNYYQDAAGGRPARRGLARPQAARAVLPLPPLHGPARPVLRDSVQRRGVARVVDARPGGRARRRAARPLPARTCATSTSTSAAVRPAAAAAGSTTAASSCSPPTTARSSTSTAAGGTARRCTTSRCTCR